VRLFVLVVGLVDDFGHLHRHRVFWRRRPAALGDVAAPAQEALSVGPLKALSQDVADVGQVEQEQRHPDDGVEYGRHLAPIGLWRHVSITCKVFQIFIIKLYMNYLSF